MINIMNIQNLRSWRLCRKVWVSQVRMCFWNNLYIKLYLIIRFMYDWFIYVFVYLQYLIIFVASKWMPLPKLFSGVSALFWKRLNMSRPLQLIVRFVSPSFRSWKEYAAWLPSRGMSRHQIKILRSPSAHPLAQKYRGFALIEVS